jgi:hypothetical protein
MGKLAIDWTQPAYGRYYVRRVAPRCYRIQHHDCALCTRPIVSGEVWSRGPRGLTGVHAACRDALLAETERRKPRPLAILDRILVEHCARAP